eukprot:6005885-Ditylum_brightwellii.AAC.1
MEQGSATGVVALFVIVAVGLDGLDSKHFGESNFVVDGHVGCNVVLLLLPWLLLHAGYFCKLQGRTMKQE